MQGEELTIAGVGDCQISTRHSPCKEKAFLDAIRLLQEADVAYANLEHLVHNYEPECYPGHRSGGTYTRAPPHVIEELKWMGIDVVSCATNHAYDYTSGGIKETIKNLDAYGLPHSGIGVNLAEARAPAFVDSRQGRIGLISVGVGCDLAGMATDARRDIQGKPGLNLLRISREYTLDPQTFNAMRNLLNKLQPFGLLGRGEPIPDDAKSFDVMMGRSLDGVTGTRFVLGDKMSIASVCHKKDLEGNLDVIDDAKRQADWVFVACHHHHTDGTNGQIPPKAVQSFAHACIDAGADGVFGSGPHQIQGIEIYNGKPIFYSFPDFIQQRDLMPKLPQTFYENLGMGFENTPMDAMDERAKTVFARLYQDPAHSESGIAVSRFRKHQVVEIKLYPVDLGLGKPRWQFGRPKLADRTLGEKIILRWAKLSEQFGTKIELKDGVGEVKLP